LTSRNKQASGITEPVQLPAWLRNVNNPDAPESLVAVSKTIKSLLRNVEADAPNHLTNVNQLLRQVDAKLANPYHAIAALRTLYTSRAHLPAWGDVQSSLRTEFSMRYANLDVDSLMCGLGPINEVASAEYNEIV
jgi:hypothetical protein